MEHTEILDAAPIIDTALTSSLKRVQSEVAAFDKIAAGLAALEQAHPASLVVDVTTTAGMKQAIAGRAAYREPRINVEKARKAAKAPVLELGKQIDQFAANLESQLRIGESNYDDQIKAEEARKEAERTAKAEAERVRVALHLAGVQEIRDHINEVVGASSDCIERRIAEVAQYQCGTAWEEFQGQAITARDETIAKLREMHAAAVAHEAEQARIKAEQEAEAARIAAEREELARLRAEQEARERAAAAERAEQERKDREARQAAEAQAAKELAEQRAKQEAELKAQREAQEAELAAQRAAQAKIEAEAKAKRDAEAARIAAERAEFERQQREAEQARIAEAEAKAKADAKTRAAAFVMLDALHEIEKLTTEPKVKAIASKAIKSAKE
jgi:hypothetical protein